MRLVFTTEDFVYAGRPRPGFPLILGKNMEPAQPFDHFLTDTLLDSGKALDVKTWDAYGSRIWDFARYLDANGFAWDNLKPVPGATVLRIYRDWQAEDLALEPSTINPRLRTVLKFYSWAQKKGLIGELPFTTSDITVRGVESDFTHLTEGKAISKKSDLLLDEWTEEPEFLTAQQIAVARCNIRSMSQRLLFDLMTRVGLRSIEARTFPSSYVFDPTSRAGVSPGSMIEVRMSPRDMQTKFSKPRVVHVPYSLMVDMHQYTLLERNRLVIAGKETKSLLLTASGNAYSKGAAWKAMHDLGVRVGFDIWPHMLRHSYAIHTLMFLRNSPDYKGEPLLYVRDRLGHRGVQTTMIYLKQIDRLAGGEAMAMMEEFDRLYDVSSALPTMGSETHAQSEQRIA